MAAAKKCDKCGKFYENYCESFYGDKQKELYNGYIRVKIDDFGQVVYSCNPIDLCPECMKEFDAFLNRDNYLSDKERTKAEEPSNEMLLNKGDQIKWEV